MAKWTDEYLNSLKAEGEQLLTTDIPVTFDRIPLDITEGVGTYTLPSNISSISNIKWKAKKILPFTLRLGEAFRIDIRPDDTRVGVPDFYLTQPYVYNTITFHPTPSETIVADESKVFSGDMDTQVIVSCYRFSDGNGNYQIPTALRRNVLKYYVLWKAYLKEGKTQDLKAAKYFESRFLFIKEQLNSIVNKIPKAITYAMEPQRINSLRTPGRPHLPWNFGVIEK